MIVRFSVTGRNRAELDEAAKKMLDAFISPRIWMKYPPMHMDVEPERLVFGQQEPVTWRADVEVDVS